MKRARKAATEAFATSPSRSRASQNAGPRYGLSVSLACLALVVGLVACGGGGGGATDTISSDGSSTVFPITAAMAEEFKFVRPDVRVTAAFSGTGGGFKRFCAGETEISNASREISQSEVDECAANGVEYEEFTVALDGIAVVVNPENDWAQCMTVAELNAIWMPGSTVTTWSDVRPDWPADEMRLYGPGTNSGTFDYFTEAIMGESGSSRATYTASEDDNVLVQGVAGDVPALGYFGFAYYDENASRLNVVAVDDGSGCVEPTPATVRGGEYTPLSRPLFIYVNRAALQRPAVSDFVRFYIENAPELVRQVGYVPLEARLYDEQIAHLDMVAGAD